MQKLTTVLIVAFAIGCSTSPPEISAQDRSRVRQAASMAPAGVSGFIRDPNTSNFAHGLQVDRVDSPNLTRIVGTEGATAIWANGYFAARPHAHSKTRSPMKDGGEQNFRVLTYFKDAGLPADQIGDVHANTTIEMSGSTGDSSESRHVVSYTTIITRKVLGVRVAESHAWAELDSNGGIIAEDVWWPEIPPQVVAELATFQSKMDDGTYRASLAKEVHERVGEIVIHHNIPINLPSMSVTFDIQDKDQLRSFDSGGHEIAVTP